MADVFISYKKADHARAENLARTLTSLGYTVWWDAHLGTGHEWFRRILREVKEAKCLIGVWTRNSIDPDGLFAPSLDDGHNYISIEHDAAGRGKIAGAVFDEKAVPLVYRDLQAAVLIEWEATDAQHPGLAKLVTRVRELAGEPRSFASGAREPLSPQRTDVLLDLRETWSKFPARGSTEAVAKFLTKVSASAPDSGLEFEVEHHLDELRRAAETEEAAHRAREEAQKAQAHTVARERGEFEADAKSHERREMEGRFGLEARSAALAAEAGKPVAERKFPLRLEGVSAWPKPQMVAVPPGRFLMGAAEAEAGASQDEFPRHEVKIDYTFALGQHSVTFAEWDAALAAGAPLQRPAALKRMRDQRPVIGVNWDDAQAYLNWLNALLGLAEQPDAYRLPSEAEWEYACRAGTTTPFHTGVTISTYEANYDGNYIYGPGRKGERRLKSTPVGSFAANAFGFHDMHGNIWEWCADSWRENYSGAPSNGSVWKGQKTSLGRVVRGGSWGCDPVFLRSASRHCIVSSNRTGDLGFRVARTL